MKKRVLAFLLTINILFLSLCTRLFSLSVLPQQAFSQHSLRTKDIATSRGIIYDRKLKPITCNKLSYIACIKPTTASLNLLRQIGEDDEALKQLTDGRFIFKSTDTPEAYKGCEDIKALPVYERYNDSRLLHIIGYTDSSGNGVCGLEKYYNDMLANAGGKLTIAYNTDANGRMMTAEPVEIRDNGYYTKQGLVLTIDADIQAILENAMQGNGISKGAGIILNTETNEILACVSLPLYDRNNLSSAINSSDSPFINRAFSAFSVGSVFKTVTAAAAIEGNTETTKYVCNGSITLNGNTFYCSKQDGHGEIDFNTAMAKSCNPYFISLGITTGSEAILSLSKKLKLGKSVDFGNGYMTDTGTIPDPSELVCNADTANLSFGQGRLTATPLQIATIFSCIGNGGYYTEPTLILGTVDKDGNTAKLRTDHTKQKILSDYTCSKLKDALSKIVTEGTGTMAFSKLYTCCTKTATAQSGQYDENGNEIKICWFTGFFPKENPQYTICIMKEQGSSGGSDCGPIFKEIAENILFNF